MYEIAHSRINDVSMGLSCYIGPWVYCTNTPSQTHLWLHLKQGKLRRDANTMVRRPLPLPSTHVSLRSGSHAQHCQSWGWQRVAPFNSPFIKKKKKQSLTQSHKPLFCFVSFAKQTFSSAWKSSCFQV